MLRILCWILVLIVMTHKVANGLATTKKLCNNTVLIDNIYYTPTTLKVLKGLPADLSINWESDNIYFTLISDQLKMSVYQLNPDGGLRKINLPANGQTSSVDNQNNIVYIGSDSGLYSIDETNLDIKETLLTGNDIMYVDILNDIIYYASWPQNTVHTYNKITKLSKTIDKINNGGSITVDKSANIYYETKANEHFSGKYVLQNGGNLVRLNGVQKDSTLNFFVSKDGSVYAMDEDSNFYLMNGSTGQANLLGTFCVNVNTFVIDKYNNIIIGAENILTKWKANSQNPCIM